MYMGMFARNPFPVITQRLLMLDLLISSNQ